MKIIGFNLSKILIKRKEKIEGKLEIKQNINIDDISKDNVTITKDDVIKINFTFNVTYNPDLAKLEFKGGLILIPEKDELKKILKDWGKKQLSNEFRTPIFNFIMNKCNIKALTLEDEMALPLHVPMPKLTIKDS